MFRSSIDKHTRTRLPYFERKKIELYKTEICRSYEENGYCRYNEKCQFAHSEDELRHISRHPRYKTEICKTYWEEGTCPYGKRCCFIHKESVADRDVEMCSIGMSEDVEKVADKIVEKRTATAKTPEPFCSDDTNCFNARLLYVRLSSTEKADMKVPGSVFVPGYDRDVAQFVLGMLDIQ